MKNTKEIAEILHPLERKLLPFLNKSNQFKELITLSGLKEVEAMRAVQWLSNKNLIEMVESKAKFINLDQNGITYIKNGLPEKRFLTILKKGPKTIKDLTNNKTLSPGEINICIGTLKGKAAIDFDKDKKIKITDTGVGMISKETLEEKFLKKKFPVLLDSLKDEEKFAFNNLIKRKGIIKIEEKKDIVVNLTDLGKKVTKINLSGTYNDKLTPEMLKTGKWKGSQFRKYDLTAKVPSVSGGKKHFLNQVIDYVKQIWLELGFTEMSGPLVQTSYWDLDALFVPQDHPARQMQDTFFIKDSSGKLPKDWKNIRDAHENGASTGSTGWNGKWSEDIAKQTMLITHDTYLSAQVLSNIKKEDLPVKTFQIMKVFRNEALDWKHLFEFYQVGGIVVDKNVNFNHLLGYLKTFFMKMGFEDVRIRPGHFPYVEPGAEIEVFHPVHKTWVELGGAGIFRPEVTKPLLGFECPVLAWGFGLGRIVMEYWKINDIRELYKNDLKQLRNMKMWMK